MVLPGTRKLAGFGNGEVVVLEVMRLVRYRLSGAFLLELPHALTWVQVAEVNCSWSRHTELA